MNLPEHGTPAVDVFEDVEAGRLAVFAYDIADDGHLIVRDAAAATYTDGIWDDWDSGTRADERDPKGARVHRDLTAASVPGMPQVGEHACRTSGLPPRVITGRACGPCDRAVRRTIQFVWKTWWSVSYKVNVPKDRPNRHAALKADAMDRLDVGLRGLVNGTPTWLRPGVPLALVPHLTPASDADEGVRLQVVSVPRARVRHIAISAMTWTSPDDSLFRVPVSELASFCGKPAAVSGALESLPDCRTCIRNVQSLVAVARHHRTQITVDRRTIQPDVVDMFDVDGSLTLLGLTP